jgi:hypothetical protein
MTGAESRQEEIAREIAKDTRRYLVALNTGGVATSFAVASSLAALGANPRWSVYPVAPFVAGLVTTGLSMKLAKVKALRRRDAAKDGVAMPDYTGWLWRNFTYEAVALALFVVGVIVGLWTVPGVTVPQNG